MGQNEFHYAYSEGNLAALMLVLGGKSEGESGKRLGITHTAINNKLKLLRNMGMPTWLAASEHSWRLPGGKLEFSAVQTKYRQQVLQIIDYMSELCVPLASSNRQGTLLGFKNYQQLVARHIVNPPGGGDAKRFPDNATLLLGCFLKIIECQSFTAASREVGIRQCSVSKNILSLRSAIGDRLCFSKKRILCLTDPVGNQVLEVAHIYFSKLNELQKLIQKINDDPELCDVR